MVRSLVFIFLATALSVFIGLTGCGRAQPFTPSDSDPTSSNLVNANADTDPAAADSDFQTLSTGSVKQFKGSDGTLSTPVSYTPAGAPEVFQKMQQDLQETSDKLMAKFVQTVDVTLLDAQSHPLVYPPVPNDPSIVQISQIPPAKIQFTVKFDPQSAVEPKELDFTADLTPNNGSLTGHSAQTTNQLQGILFTADVDCLNPTCEDIELRVHKHLRELSGSVSTSLADIGIFYRQTHPEVSVQKSRNTDTYQDAALESLQQLPKQLQATRSSVSVVDGPSYSRISIPELNPSASGLPNMVQIDTDLTDTQSESGQVNSVSVPQSDSHIEGHLVGNNPETGSITVDLTAKNEVTRIHIDEPDMPPAVNSPAPTVPKIVLDELHNRTDSTKLVQVSTDKDTHPLTVDETEKLQDRAKDPETQRLIQVWLGNEHDRKTCKSEASRSILDKLLANGPAVLPYLEKVTDVIDVTPEIAYILPLESSYLTNPARPTLEIGHSRDPNEIVTAIGPWMINDGTAETIKNKLGQKVNFNIVLNNHPDPSDDRTYFLNSTYMASLYLKDFFRQFDADPGIAILAYHVGGGAADKSAKRTAPYVQFDISLADIQKNHIATKTNCESINYAYTVLALRTIGQNLDLYHLSIPDKSPSSHKLRLKRPNGPLPPGIDL
jgi:Transglycosylase SLT domain